MNEAAVLAECAAQPDDDGPRLVWADLVGGERGELVVLQCDLARGDLSPVETAQRRRRERDLLEAHAVEWAGPLATIATRWSFRRGFIETARFEAFDAAKVADHPLLSSVTLDSDGARTLFDAIAAHLPIRGLAIETDPHAVDDLQRLADSPHVGRLRALSIEALDSNGVDAVHALIERAQLDQLWLPHHRAEHARVEELVLAAAQATTLVVDRPLDLDRPLRGFVTTYANLKSLARTSRDTLEVLGCKVDTIGQSVDWLAELRELRVLAISGQSTSEVVRQLARSQAFAKLRVLRIQGSVSVPDVNALAERFRDQLELLELPHRMPIVSTLAIAGEVRSEPTHTSWRRTFTDELLHQTPSTLLVLGAPCCVRSQRAAFARIDQHGPIWDIPSVPAEQPAHIGRVNDNLIALPAERTVSRRQCELTWREGQHHVRELGSTNGILVENVRVAESKLVDGNELRAGAVILQYFVGPGARERAEAAVERSKAVDANTRLPINGMPPFVIEIASWPTIAHRWDDIGAQQIMRSVASELTWFAAGEQVWFVRPGVFGASAATADRVGRTRTVTIDIAEVEDTSIEVELVTIERVD